MTTTRRSARDRLGDDKSATFDSIECAAAQLAPECAHCGCRILGHGIETPEAIFCCAHCARKDSGTPRRQRSLSGARGSLIQRRIVATMPARYPSRATSDGRKSGPPGRPSTAAVPGSLSGAGRPAWCPCRAKSEVPTQRRRLALLRDRLAAREFRRPASRELHGFRRCAEGRIGSASTTVHHPTRRTRGASSARTCSFFFASSGGGSSDGQAQVRGAPSSRPVCGRWRRHTTPLICSAAVMSMSGIAPWGQFDHQIVDGIAGAAFDDI